MKYLVAFVCAFLMLCPASVRACHCYIWAISRSATSPKDNQGAPAGGVINLYLWLYHYLGYGVSTAELGLDGTIIPTQFIPEPGFQSSGTVLNLQLTLDVCPLTEHTLIGTITCNEPAEGGTLCIAPPLGGSLDTSPCPPPEVHDEIIGWVGYSSVGGVYCEAGGGYSACGVDAIEPATWGGIKSTYRKGTQP